MIRRFDRAANGYEKEARVQEQVAAKLDEWMSGLAISAVMQRGLEIGCGSGLLTRRLLQRWPAAEWMVSDIAPAMVRQCAASLDPASASGIRFMAGDGEDAGCFPGTFDLIVANLAVQWFEKPFDSVRNLADKLNPGGWLVFSTLGDRSFETLRSRTGLSFYDYPPASAWKEQIAGWCPAFRVERHHFNDTARDLKSFLREWKRLGAATPSGHRPIARSALRQAIVRSASEASGLAIEYDVLFIAARSRSGIHKNSDLAGSRT